MRCASCGVDGAIENGFCKHCGAAVLDAGSSRLGPYILLSKLGEGGMGIVYRAQDEKLGREVALKVLHPHLLRHEELKDRFRREARMHAKIIHPNVVTLLSLYESGEHMALVMEMVHGVNLRQYLREHPNITLAEIISIADAILSGLDAAHKLGVVHRDLKPANVLLARDGTVKLMDFGLAKPIRGDEDLTQSGATVGSFRYMAPEQILHQAVDARTDLYAFGILLYQMCTGKLPFDASAQGGGEFEIMEKQVRQQPVPPIKLNPNLPQELSDLIMNLLAKDPDERPANCAVVREALSRIAAQAGASASGQVIMSAPPEESRSNIEIAQGLLAGLAAKSQRIFHLLRERQKRVAGGVKEACSRLVTAGVKKETLRAALVWGGVLIVLGGLGWLLTSAIHVAEKQSAAPAPSAPEPAEQPKQQEASVDEQTQTQPSAQSTTKPEPTAKQATADAPKQSAPPKPAPHLAAKNKPQPQHRPRHGPERKKSVTRVHQPTPITYRIAHKVVRSDGSQATQKDAHEFKGGSRLFFPELKSYRWKDVLHTFKRGQLRLYLSEPAHVSKVVIHKASVGDLDFKGGYIRLSLQDTRGRWHLILDRKDADIDQPLTIPVAKSIGVIKGVRMRFRSAEPITIGPIDLLP